VRARRCKKTTRGLDPSGTSSQGQGRVWFAQNLFQANGPASASVIAVNRRRRGGAVPSRPRESPGNREANDDSQHVRFTRAHQAEIATGRMTTKRASGQGRSVPRTNRRGSSAAQRRPGNSANAKASYEKYLALARAAARIGDVIETENCYQHAEHYFRLMQDERNESSDEESVSKMGQVSRATMHQAE